MLFCFVLGRQHVNRDMRLSAPGVAAGTGTIHSMEMSLLGQEATNNMRRASFNMTVGCDFDSH